MASKTTIKEMEYWKATMFAKALVMAYKDGKGPAQGFHGYPEAPEVQEAKVAMNTLLNAILNAETKPFLEALPKSWITAFFHRVDFSFAQ